MHMKITFTPVDYNAFDFEAKNYMKIVGRLENGKRVCIVDTCDSYFWVILEEGLSKKDILVLQEKISELSVVKSGRKSEVINITPEKKKFLEKEVDALKVYVTNYKDASDIAHLIDFKGVAHVRGYDLGFVTHYIIERALKPLETYEIEGEKITGTSFEQVSLDMEVDFCLEVQKIKQLQNVEPFQPKVLAFDIECDAFEIGRGSITMISLYGAGFEKVLTWKEESKKKYVEHFDDEALMLEAFVRYVKEYDPDVITGYFSDGFDLPYIRARADKLKVNLSLGLDGSKPTFSRGRMMNGKVSGIVHVDILRFIRNAYSQYLQSETLSLDDVSEELLGEKKVAFDAFKAMSQKEVDWETFYKYNLKDSELTYKLFLKIWPDILEMTRITNEPLFITSRSTMASCFEDYVIHNLPQFNEIPEKMPTNQEIGRRRMDKRYEGGFVFQPTPGLYENIMFFDFSSMYGSVTVSYNLSRGTYLKDHETGCVEGDYNGKKVYFAQKRGVVPELLLEIINRRRVAKEAYNKHPSAILRARSNAFKLVANAAYGYQGFFGARYYSIEAAASTAYFARENIKKAIATFEKQGFDIVYSDTDSVAIALERHTKKEALEVLKKINKNLPGIMELDFEGLFARGIWVTTRSGEFGAKKKYALIDEEGNLKIRGFETVRRDWCNVARKLQSNILKAILEDGNEKRAVELVKEIVSKIKNRAVDFDDLIIRTKLKKDISEYVSEGPHVVAAKKMKKANIPVSVGTLIEYYVSDEKGKRIGDKVKLRGEKGDYDIEYYLQNQIVPAVQNILDVFEVTTDDLISGHTQKGLGDF